MHGAGCYGFIPVLRGCNCVLGTFRPHDRYHADETAALPLTHCARRGKVLRGFLCATKCGLYFIHAGMATSLCLANMAAMCV